MGGKQKIHPFVKSAPANCCCGLGTVCSRLTTPRSTTLVARYFSRPQTGRSKQTALVTATAAAAAITTTTTATTDNTHITQPHKNQSREGQNRQHTSFLGPAHLAAGSLHVSVLEQPPMHVRNHLLARDEVPHPIARQDQKRIVRVNRHLRATKRNTATRGKGGRGILR